MKIKGGRKLKRCIVKKNYYAAGFRRVAHNKIRRLTKRLAFDPQAEGHIKRLRGI